MLILFRTEKVVSFSMDENTMKRKKKMVAELSEKISFLIDENTMKGRKKTLAEVREEIICD